MTGSLISGCFWVLAATVTAMLPMQRQMVPGLILLATAPLIIAWIGWQHGWIFAILGLLAFLSMFRNPLKYLWKKARGGKPDLPEEIRRGLRR